MAKVNKVEKARKAIPEAGIEIGDTYYWWKFRYGARRVSKTYPKPQQLTQSGFAIGVFDIQDRINELNAQSFDSESGADELKQELQDIADDIRALGEEQQDNLNNMPEGLQQGPTGELLQERHDACESWADEIESIDVDEPNHDDTEREVRGQYLDELEIKEDDDGKLTRELNQDEETELENRIEAKVRQEMVDACETAIDEAKAAQTP